MIGRDVAGNRLPSRSSKTPNVRSCWDQTRGPETLPRQGLLHLGAHRVRRSGDARSEWRTSDHNAEASVSVRRHRSRSRVRRPSEGRGKRSMKTV